MFNFMMKNYRILTLIKIVYHIFSRICGVRVRVEMSSNRPRGGRDGRGGGVGGGDRRGGGYNRGPPRYDRYNER